MANEMALRFRVEASMAEAKAALDQGSAAFRKFGTDAKAAMSQAATGYQGMVNDFAGVKVDFSSAAASADVFAGELDRVESKFNALRASVDPAYAATMRLADAQNMARIAVANFGVTQTQADAILASYTQKLGIAQGAAQNFATAQTAVMAGASRNASATANIAAQFNDIGVMLAAGQNPFMLAIQQGTQISQVLNQAGGGVRGAAEALKSGFMALISPVSLLTVGLIAGGAALVYWAAEAVFGADETKKFEEAVTDLEAAVTNFSTKSSVGLADLREKFGEVTPEVIRLNEQMSNLAGAQAIIAATEAIRSLKAETEGSWLAAFTDKAFSDFEQIAAMLDVESLQSVFDEALGRYTAQDNPAIQAFQEAVEAASSARGWDDQIAAVARIQEVIIEAAGGIDNMSMKQAELLAQVQATEVALRSQKAAHDSAADALGESAAQAKLVSGWFEIANANISASAVAADKLARAKIADGVVNAGNAALTLAQRLWNAYSAAASIASLQMQSVSLGGAGRPEGTDIDPDARGAVMLARIQIAQKAAADKAAAAAAAAASGGGSSGPARDSVAGLSAQAADALAALDLAIATINEKVKAGLMSTAEAGDALTGAREKAGNDVAAIIAQVDRLGPAGQAAANALRASLITVTADLQKPISDLAKSLSEGLSDPLKDALKGTKSLADAFDAMGDRMIDKLIDVAVQEAQVQLFQPLIGGLFSSFGGSNLGASILGAFGVGGGAANSKMNPMGGVNRAMGIAGGQLGRDVGGYPSQPTGGRTASMGSVTVNIMNNASGTEIRQTERTQGNDRFIDVMIEQIDSAIGAGIRTGRGSTGRAISETYGMQRSPR